MKIYSVIMAGGSGTRLWPLSRSSKPKQFLNFLGDISLLQQALLRAKILGGESIIVCPQKMSGEASRQARDILKDSFSILIEPESKGTAAAATLAALEVHDRSKDGVVVLFSADHYIPDSLSFAEVILKAVDLALSDYIVSIGVQVKKIESGYGYIEKGGSLDGGYLVKKFVEKPAYDLAKEFFEKKENYLWNSGIFVFKASTFLSELRKLDVETYSACFRYISSLLKDVEGEEGLDEFLAMKENSLDYALMEKTDKAAVVEFDGQWSDMGSWEAVWENGEKDVDGNLIEGDVISFENKDTLIKSSGKLIAAVGLKNVFIIEQDDAILVIEKNKSQDVKKVVAELKNKKRSELNYEKVVERPWGTFESVHRGERHQVKKIRVEPGQKLSLQMHYHRAEHWIVVSGTARVYLDEKSFLLTENQSTYIPFGVKHCLENPGKVLLEIIEVQSGAYLGEDDIVRFSDIYGRE